MMRILNSFINYAAKLYQKKETDITNFTENKPFLLYVTNELIFRLLKTAGRGKPQPASLSEGGLQVKF